MQIGAVGNNDIPVARHKADLVGARGIEPLLDSAIDPLPLDQPHQSGIAAEVYERFRSTRRIGPPFGDVPSAFRAIVSSDTRAGEPRVPSEAAEEAWEDEVGDLVPRPDLASVSVELFDLMADRLGMISPA